jgi:hypothetical protein
MSFGASSFSGEFMITTMDEPKYIYKCDKGHINRLNSGEPEKCKVCGANIELKLKRVITKGK